jgi:hypothetical protein
LAAPPDSLDAAILFPAGFRQPPTVQVFMLRVEAETSHCLRIDATAKDVSTDGFTLHAYTWEDGVVHSASFGWIAIGS